MSQEALHEVVIKKACEMVLLAVKALMVTLGKWQNNKQNQQDKKQRVNILDQDWGMLVMHLRVQPKMPVKIWGMQLRKLVMVPMVALMHHQ